MITAIRLAAETRLAQLRQDLINGRAQLAQLQDVLPKIEGAVQILEELLAPPAPAQTPAHGAAPEETTPCPNPNAAAPTNSPSVS